MPATDAPPDAAAPAPRLRAVRRAGVVLAVTVVALLTASVTGLLPLQVMRVSSGSMSPTIATGDLVVVERGDAPARRRDVVALPGPDGRGLLVKRVVGVGGDTVSVEDGVLVVNGERVCEPDTDQAALDGSYFGPFVVPDGQLFLLGDDRAESVDSIDFGPLPADTVVGHVRTRLFPHPGRLAGDSC